jgi:hypothetical protein
MDKEEAKKILGLLNFEPSKEALMGLDLIDRIEVRKDLPKDKAGFYKKKGSDRWLEIREDYRDNPRLLMHELEHAYFADKGIGGHGKPSPMLDSIELRDGWQRRDDRGIGAKVVINTPKGIKAVNRQSKYYRTEVDPRVDSDQHLLIYNRPLDETREYQMPIFRFNETLRNDKLVPNTQAFGLLDVGSPFMRFQSDKLRKRKR